MKHKMILTNTDKKIILSIWDGDKIKSGYSFQQNNRLTSPSLRKLEKANVIIREQGFYKINEKILPDTKLKKIEENLTELAKEKGEIKELKVDLDLRMLSNKTINELYKNSKEVIKRAKEKVKD